MSSTSPAARTATFLRSSGCPLTPTRVRHGLPVSGRESTWRMTREAFGPAR